MYYGSRHRETLRRTVRAPERGSHNAIGYVKRAFDELYTKRKLLPEVNSRLESMRKRMRLCRGPGDIQEWMTLKQEAARLESDMDRVRSGVDARVFFERARPLIAGEGGGGHTGGPSDSSRDSNGDQKREALAMTLFHPDKAVPVFIQTDRCTECDDDLKYHEEESVMVCPRCNRSYAHLQLSTDHVDVDYIGQDTNSNHTRSTPTGGVDKMSTTNTAYAKPNLYRKFLMQFSDSVPTPPDAVIEVILREMSKVHLHHSSKAQPTPIGAILRKCKMKQWAWMSVRIAMMIKMRPDETVPVFCQTLIDRIIARFEKLVTALQRTRCRNRQKVFNFRFLTKVFLVMEGEYALSELFENHKTRAVQLREDRRMTAGCRILEREMKENGFSWKFFRTL